MISIDDVRELYASLVSIDKQTFYEEIEIVKAFQMYMQTSKEAPEIIIKECQLIIDKQSN
ncbi:hypothetical protein [Sulfurimonas sp.]|uniref:hypothetical protein n=1 Tax=Sulfurimonas sp. TaxID=2022749 RepID=UPI0025DA98D7|nr:hypothetical protein [Sulfurimonas sp.]